MKSAPAENVMGTAPVPSLLLRMSVPMMLSLMTNSLYNVVDSIFVSRLNEQALTALSLAAPVQALVSAMGSGIAVGLNAAVSKALGAKDRETVRHTVSASFFLAFCAYILVALIGAFGSEAYFQWQSDGNAAITAYGEIYLRICMVFSFGQLAQWVLDRCLMATGRSVLFLYSLAFASVINIILDPILIFGLLGFPALGTTGAAIATVCGQIGGALFCTFLNLRWNREIPLRVTLRIRLNCALTVLRVGVPTALMQGAVAMTGIVMNLVLQSFSTTAVAIYGVCNRIQGLALISVNGINLSLVPIAAYNFGARRRDRVLKTILWAIVESLLFMGATLLVLECLPRQILTLFDASNDMLHMGAPAIRLISLGYFISVFCLVFSSTFQAFGKGNYSMTLTLLRQAAFPLLLVSLFARSGVLMFVWLAFPLSEVLSIPFALILFRKLKSTIIDHI